MFAMLGMLWKYRSVLSMAVGAYKAFKSVKKGQEPPKSTYKVADYLREVHETKELIDGLEDRSLRRDLRREYRAVRREAKKVGSLAGFDQLQERIKELHKKASKA